MKTAQALNLKVTSGPVNEIGRHLNDDCKNDTFLFLICLCSVLEDIRTRRKAV
ncbi:BnaC04g31770D [Brassica napus]|uniref:BnaC04g31770D protein n=1 Tax=Brassica napus TaxID=3708 RepID=A0A078GXN6_BRANA|nr:BnaC04g31770D [Brassica napus]